MTERYLKSPRVNVRDRARAFEAKQSGGATSESQGRNGGSVIGTGNREGGGTKRSDAIAATTKTSNCTATNLGDAAGQKLLAPSGDANVALPKKAPEEEKPKEPKKVKKKKKVVATESSQDAQVPKTVSPPGITECVELPRNLAAEEVLPRQPDGDVDASVVDAVAELIPPKNTLELVKQFNEIAARPHPEVQPPLLRHQKSTSLDSGLSEMCRDDDWNRHPGRRKREKGNQDSAAASVAPNPVHQAVAPQEETLPRAQRRTSAGKSNGKQESFRDDGGTAEAKSRVWESAAEAGSSSSVIFSAAALSPAPEKWIQHQQDQKRDRGGAACCRRSSEKDEPEKQVDSRRRERDCNSSIEEPSSCSKDEGIKCCFQRDKHREYYGENGGQNETSQIAELLTSVQRIKEEFERCSLDDDESQPQRLTKTTAEEPSRSVVGKDSAEKLGFVGKQKELGGREEKRVKVRADYQNLARVRASCRSIDAVATEDKNNRVNAFREARRSNQNRCWEPPDVSNARDEFGCDPNPKQRANGLSTGKYGKRDDESEKCEDLRRGVRCRGSSAEDSALGRRPLIPEDCREDSGVTSFYSLGRRRCENGLCNSGGGVALSPLDNVPRMERRPSPLTTHGAALSPNVDDRNVVVAPLSPLSVHRLESYNPFSAARFTPSPQPPQQHRQGATPAAAAGKVHVRSKPELPSYFRPTLRKVTSDPHAYESAAISDCEKAELDSSIETILGELDFSKFRRGGVGSSPSSFLTPLRSTTPQAPLVAPKSHENKLRELRELTEKLKPAISKARQEVNLTSGYGYSTRATAAPPSPHAASTAAANDATVPLDSSSSYKTRSLSRRRNPVYRSASVPQVDGLEGEEDLASTSSPYPSWWHVLAPSAVPVYASSPMATPSSHFDFRGFATLPRRNTPGARRTTAAPTEEPEIGMDEGLVADSAATSDYVHAYRALTSSASAPATPGSFHRTLASAAPPPTSEQLSFTFGSLDRRKRRKNGGGDVLSGVETLMSPAKSGTGRSLTYPPQRRGSIGEGMEYTSVDSNGMRSLGTVPGAATAEASVTGGQGRALFPSELSLADSHLSPSEMNYDVSYGDVLESVASTSDLEKSATKPLKKKHYSDPSGDKNEGGLLDLPEFIACAKSEPQLPRHPVMTGGQQENKRSTVPLATPCQHQTVSELALDGVSALVEGDTKSPLQQRRYSKKRLRGPYGEMLEEEMRKSGEKQLQKLIIAEELSFLNDFVDKKVEATTSQQRPSPPTSPTESSSHHMSSRSLDEDVLHSSAAILDKVNSNFHRRKISANIPLAVGEGDADDSPPLPLPLSLAVSVPSFLGGPPINDETWNLCEVLDTDGEDLESLLRQPQDTRTHVVAELYDTEKSYVESLQILINKYFHPLKSPEYSGLVDSTLVDEMFFEIPEILAHHEIFLDVLRQRLENWDNKQKVGDVFVDSFTKQAVIDTYTAFINNWKTAKEAIKVAIQAKPAFAKFLEHMSREHRGKLTLDALLIMPVQRIPRYELLIKELLKHTQMDHPDHRLLVIAQKEVHDLAVKINRMEREAYEAERMQLKLKEMEGMIEGLIDLVHPLRIFLRYELVTMSGSLGTKKERCLFLFSDLLIITSIKRKSGTIRRTTSSLGSTSSLQNLLETNKYKLLMRISLDDLDVARTNDANIKKVLNDIQQLEEDVITLNQINDLAGSLNCPHQNLDEVVKEMVSSMTKQLQEKQTSDSQLLCLELTVTTQVGMETMPIIFLAPEKRATWEAAFHEAKQKLASSTDRRPPPEFMYPLPIRKTRAGLQFTCAAPTLGLNSHNLRDVWVCNSDGYVGQVCVLSLQPEPTVTSCNGVCNARILCITSIPATATSSVEGPMINCRRSTYLDSKSGISISIEDVDEEEMCGGNGNIQLDSDSSEDEKETSSDCPEEDNSRKKRETSPMDDTKQDEVDSHQPTMWLGTEDGCIHVYNCNDNIRIKKNKIKLQHSAAIHCILYLDGRVFISLANGDLSVYNRDQSGGGWETNEPTTVNVGSSVAPITRMIAVMGKLWCGCQNIVKIINILSLESEYSFAVHLDTNRPIHCMVTSGLGVWISVQNSSVIKLYHATSYETLLDVNVAPAVAKMLAGCDDIIRQHKAACLRVTSLLTCKDLLWVGTSAGVVLNLALPHLTSTTSKLTIAPNVSGIPHGHTGHVRFLTCVEMTPSQDGLSRTKYTHRSIKYKDGLSVGRRASTSTLGSNRLLVISGGDGYEDFRNTNYSEAAGRDDSTNHLLLWQM